MRMTNCSKRAAESYVDSKLEQISAQLIAGRKPAELGKLTERPPQPDPRFRIQ